jgi:ribose/xylose/arabinose/galactoside ABC-type transport system permease subunit
MILTVLNNGLGLLNATSTQILLINGLILLAVVLLDGRLGAAVGRMSLGNRSVAGPERQ